MKLLLGTAMTCIVFLVACSKQNKEPEILIETVQEQAVAMPDQFAADVAMQIMNAGGNAVDAAIAAQFSLAVTYPEAGNIGGGGFMLTYMDGKTNFLDYRETAPSGASRDMYLNDAGEVVSDLPVYGILASGVPGTVAGMWAAHQKYGSLPWEDLVAPAISLAEDGFVVPNLLFERVEAYQSTIVEKSIKVNFVDYFGGIKAGERFVQQELANTLKRIQKQGSDGFYTGETAKSVVDFMRAKNGLITEQDLASYSAKWREPVTTQWREFTVVSASPPSSGGIAIAQWLQMFDRVKGRSGAVEHNSPQYIHILAEIGKRVFADRAEYLGDPDFYEVPQSALLSSAYLDSRAAEVSLEDISRTANVKPGLAESHDTTHFSIVDRFGNAVSNTTTINLSFGSGMVVEGAGFLLNNEMDDFSAKAGVANSFGAVGGDANAIAPNKRMLSSMSPTIVLEQDKMKLVTGSPGGTTIISSVYLSILNAIEFQMSAQDIVDSPRFHHQLLPKDTIFYHETLSDDAVTELQQKGYVMRAGNFGDLQVIVNTEKGLDAASESRNRGTARVVAAEARN
jgi:gamma-glutamyltranspeptidase/glutathione hydrolase